MDSKVLLGVITVTIFGSFAVSGMFVQAGLEDLEVIIVPGNVVSSMTPTTLDSTATCPMTHKVIGGGLATLTYPGAGNTVLIETIDIGSNSYVGSFEFDTFSAAFQVFASCAKINFPISMGMVGGELLDINTMALLVGAIGTNPVITGLVALTMVGVAAQAAWFIHRRKKKVLN